MDLLDVRARARRLAVATVDTLRDHDLALTSAGVTFYGGVALVPTVLVALWLTAGLVGDAAVSDLGARMAEVLPGELGADRAARTVVAAALDLSALPALVALVPASLYGEGLRRAFVRLSGTPDRLVGWRGRLRVLPLFVLAPVLTLALLLVAPLLGSLFGTDSFARTMLGVLVAFYVDLLVLVPILAFVYRVVGPVAPAWWSVAWAALGAGACVAGFVQGFVLFLSLPIDLGAPFGGFTSIGAAVAVVLWLWVLHLLVLVGYAAALRLDAVLARTPALAQTPVVARG